MTNWARFAFTFLSAASSLSPSASSSLCQIAHARCTSDLRELFFAHTLKGGGKLQRNIAIAMSSWTAKLDHPALLLYRAMMTIVHDGHHQTPDDVLAWTAAAAALSLR